MDTVLPPLFPSAMFVLATGYEEVTADTASGFVVFQFRVTLQLLPPRGMEQDGGVEEMEPDMETCSTHMVPLNEYPEAQ
jgi:hypothetical protein